MNVGERLREVRKNRGITISYITGKLDKTPSWLSSIEKGRYQINVDDLLKILNIIGIPVEGFFKQDIFKRFV